MHELLADWVVSSIGHPLHETEQHEIHQLLCEQDSEDL